MRPHLSKCYTAFIKLKQVINLFKIFFFVICYLSGHGVVERQVVLDEVVAGVELFGRLEVRLGLDQHLSPFDATLDVSQEKRKPDGDVDVTPSPQPGSSCGRLGGKGHPGEVLTFVVESELFVAAPGHAEQGADVGLLVDVKHFAEYEKRSEKINSFHFKYWKRYQSHLLKLSHNFGSFTLN